ncbi:MAG TPA: S53 family peptidase, partial [Polyangia bacterium]
LLLAAGLPACVGGGADPQVAVAVNSPELAQTRTFRDVRQGITAAGEVYFHAAVCGGGKYRCKSRVRTDAVGHPLVSPDAGGQSAGYGPSDLASAYAIDTTLKPNATIAVVDAYGYANLESDLAAYRSMYSLPACTTASGCLKIVDQTGGTNLPGAPPANDDWTVETALDVDMASAACPNCKILVVQAEDDQGDGLDIAQAAAAKLGATVISNSWGGTTQGSDAMSQEMYFTLTTKTGIFVASGDDGYDNYLSGQTGPDYPSTSEYVIAVGGTNLVKSAGTTRGWTERAWGAANGGKVSSSDGAGGSSCSDALAIPTWQNGIATSCKFRAASDVAAVGDPETGLVVYNKASGGAIGVGGTSASSPFVAGVFALYGHGMNKADFVYTNKTAWNDVTTGINGTCANVLCQAGTGWDGPTGLGTPNGKALAMIPPTDSNDTPPDMAKPLDMSTPPDMAEASGVPGEGSSGGGGSTGTGGNGGSGGSADHGGGGGGCSLGGGDVASGGLWIFLVLGAGLLGRGLRVRRRP